MQRWIGIRFARHATTFAAVPFVALFACATLKETAAVDPADADEGEVDSGPSDARLNDAPVLPTLTGDFEKVRATLDALASPIVQVTTNTAIWCSEEKFFWLETNGAIHSYNWSAKKRIDYEFTSATTGSASDKYVVVKNAPGLTIYDADATNKLVGSLERPDIEMDYALADGVAVGLLGGAKAITIGFWTPASLDTSIQSIPKDVNSGTPRFVKHQGSRILLVDGQLAPFSLWSPDVSTKTLGAGQTVLGTSHLVDGAQEDSGQRRIVIGYSRPEFALRVYAAGTPVEIGDLIASKPPVLTGVTNPIYRYDELEHRYLGSKIAVDRQRVIYGSAYGVFAYDLDKGTLVPLQLNALGSKTVTSDLCVLPKQRVLLYYRRGDPTNTVYAVELKKILGP